MLTILQGDPLKLPFLRGVHGKGTLWKSLINDFRPESSEFFNANVSLARPRDASIVAIGSPQQPLIDIQDLRDGE